MQFRNPEKEKALQDSELSQTFSKLNSTQELKKKQFNIISHEGPPRKIDLIPRIPKEKFGSRPFHVLSNLSHNGHETVSLYYDEDYNMSNYAKEDSKPSTTTMTTTTTATIGHTRSKPLIKKREFNIVSNQYFENADNKLENEYNRLKNRVVDKYWETHNYDIIKGKYYDLQKERNFQDQKDILRTIQGKSQELNYPPSIQYSEGHSYNIINNDLYDDLKLQVTMTTQNRTLNRMTRDLTEARLKEETEEQAEINNQRKLNKISFKRWESEIDRGYHPIKNEVITNPPLPVPSRPADMWSRLNSNNANNINSHNGIATAPGMLQQQSSTNPLFPVKATWLSSNTAAEENTNTNTNHKPFVGGNSATNHSARYGSDTGRSDMSNLSSVSGRMTSAREGYNYNNKTNRSGSHLAVPSLNMARAETGEPVKYNIPPNAPPGMAISMVRTGGLSSYR